MKSVVLENEVVTLYLLNIFLYPLSTIFYLIFIGDGDFNTSPFFPSSSETCKRAI